MYVCRVILVDNKLLAGRKCDISVCTADIFKHRDYLVRGKSVFSYCGIILLTRPDYTFSRRATFSPDAFILLAYILNLHEKVCRKWVLRPVERGLITETLFQVNEPKQSR